MSNWIVEFAEFAAGRTLIVGIGFDDECRDGLAFIF